MLHAEPFETHLLSSELCVLFIYFLKGNCIGLEYHNILSKIHIIVIIKTKIIDKNKSCSNTIILGRPFMKTAKTKVDVDDGTMSMEFGDIVAKFNIFDAMKHPVEEHSVFNIELISELVDESYSELFAFDFPSLSDFDDDYSCPDCTNTNVCVLCADIDASLQPDTFPTGEVVTDEAVLVV